jgi:uncharacterized protein YndB with AHSA1/START domain
MERKTQVHAAAGQHDMTITRIFELPVALLFRAYEEPELLSQWMGTKVLHMDSRKHGSYQIETSTPQGQVAFRASGVYHEFIPGDKIIRTFEMEGTPFGVQLEIYSFEALDEDRSQLTMHVLYESVAQRDQVLQLPFAQGINFAHNRMQDLLLSLK